MNSDSEAMSCDAPTTPRAPTQRFRVEVMLTSTHSNIWLLDRVYESVDHDLNTAAGDVELVTGTGPDDAVRSARAGASMRLKCDGHDFVDRVITEEHAHRVLSVASSVPLPKHLVNELEERLGEQRDD